MTRLNNSEILPDIEKNVNRLKDKYWPDNFSVSSYEHKDASGIWNTSGNILLQNMVMLWL